MFGPVMEAYWGSRKFFFYYILKAQDVYLVIYEPAGFNASLYYLLRRVVASHSVNCYSHYTVLQFIFPFYFLFS